MVRARELYERVREAQAMLGTGEVEEAVARAEALRTEALTRLEGAVPSGVERSYALAAFGYATVTVILGLAETLPPREFIPRIRFLAVEAARRYRPGSDVWKALAAAAEMLARAGDVEGAVWALRKAEELRPGDADLERVAAGVRTMYPQAYEAAIADTRQLPAGLTLARANIVAPEIKPYGWGADSDGRGVTCQARPRSSP